jgi:hypothetical protein
MTFKKKPHPRPLSEGREEQYQGFKGFKRIWGASLEIVFRIII